MKQLLQPRLLRIALLTFLMVSLVISGVFTGALAQPVQAATPNLLFNPGFEEPGGEHDPVPGWNMVAENERIMMEVTDELSFEGSNSLIVRDESTSHPIIVYSDPIEVTPGDTLHLKLQSTNTSGTVYAGIRTYTTPNAGIVNQALTNNWVQLSTGTGWIEHERESVPVPEEATIARVLVYTLVSGLGETIVDDIHLSVQEKIEIPFELTDLGTFVHDVTISRAGFYTEPSGREIAYAVMGGTPTYLLVIDVETEEVLKQIPIEDRINGVYYEGGYPRGMTVLPDGTVYIAGTPANLFKYTPGDDKVHYVLKFPGTAVFDLKNGPEGIIVGGSYRNNEIFEYNTVTEELTHLGRATEDQFYTYSVAYDPVRDDYYFGTGSTAHLIRYDRETGEKTEIALPERFSSAQWVWDMKVVEDKLFMRLSPGASLAYNLATGEFEDTDRAITSRFVSDKSPVDNKLYFTHSTQLGYYDFDTQEYHMLGIETYEEGRGFAFLELDDPEFPGVTLVGIMGGRLMKYNLETGKVTNNVLAIEGKASGMHSLAKGNDGKIHISAFISGGNAIYDPVTGETEEYSKLTVGKEHTVPGNQTDTILSYKDKIYFVTYGSMRVYEYDQSLPWDRQHPEHPNPRFLFTASDVGGQDRGWTGVVMPEEGKLVIGTVPDYGLLGGALVIYDLETDEREVHWNVIDQQSVTAVTYKDGLIYGGSNIWGGLGINPTESEAKLFIWDVEKKEKVFETVPVSGKRGITELIVGPDGMIWGSAEGDLFIFDPDTREVVLRKNLVTRSYSTSTWRDTSFEIGTDGNVYGVQGNQFFMIDAKTKEKTVIRNVGKRHELAQDDFGHFYLTEDQNVLKISLPDLVVKPTGARLDVSSTELDRGDTAEIRINGLLEKGRTIERMDKRDPQYYSSDPSVVSFGDSKLIAGHAGTSEVWAEVVIDGQSFETNRITITVVASLDTSLNSLEETLTAFVQDGQIHNALASPLRNALNQVRHFVEKENITMAVKHLGDFLKHLDNFAREKQITQEAKETLISDAQAVLTDLEHAMETSS